MKATMDTTGTDGGRRGLFRRSRRPDDDASTHEAAESGDREGEREPDPQPAQHGGTTDDAVRRVDDIARRIEELTAASAGPAVADKPSGEAFDMQRAVIARANDLAATSPAAGEAPPVSIPTPSSTTPSGSEAHVQQPAPTDTDKQPRDEASVETRMDAALAPVSMPATAAENPAPPKQEQAAVTLDPTPAPAPAAQPPAAELAPTRSRQADQRDGAAASLGIDLDRLVRLIEDEAQGVHHRMELEVRSAEDEAQQIIDRAEAEAERIREHGQSQARVLLGEVEEIISEAQQTGEQILHRANDEASTLRRDATAVLQQAQTEARAIVETARREGEQVLAEQRRLATVRAQEAMREQDRLKDQIRRLEERRRQVLESLEPLISQLTQMMPAGATDQNVVQLQRQDREGS